ncbi:hypothetical protein HYY75_11755, partial [bacterium]|nr:hypothetical protein [bacterium]
LKNSIVINDMKAQRQVLSATIGSLENRIDSLVDLIKFSPIDGEKPFQNFLGTLGKIFGSTAGLILRFHNDGSTECLARLDSSQCPKLEPFEEKIVKTIQENPSKKVIVQEKPGGPKLYGYPLSNGSRLNGVLLIQIAENQNYESGLIDVVAQLAKEHLSLLVLREERDLWENFYQTNLKE